MIVCQSRVLLMLLYRHGSVDSVVTIRGALGDVGATTLSRMGQVCEDERTRGWHWWSCASMSCCTRRARQVATLASFSRALQARTVATRTGTREESAASGDAPLCSSVDVCMLLL